MNPSSCCLFSSLRSAQAAFYVLHRTPHARAIPSIAKSAAGSKPGSWIETGKTFSHFSIGMTAGSILVRHPEGDLLIDTGNSSHFAQDVSIYPFWLRLKLESLAGQLNPDVLLPEMLLRGGEDPAKPSAPTLQFEAKPWEIFR